MTRLRLRADRLGPGGPAVEVVVADGLVASVGPPGHAGSSGELLDLGDATLLPGLVDSHVHVEQWAHRAHRVDVSGTGSPAEVADRMRAHLDGRPGPTDGADGVLMGHGFVDGLWSTTPHREVLDGAVGDVAVAVVSSDLHTAWLSSAALAVLDRPGHPTGVLREQEAMEVMAGLQDAVAVTQVDAWVADVLAGLPARGVTGLIDFEYADTLAAWTRRATPPVRVRAAVWEPWLDAAVAGGRRTGQVLEGTGGRVHVGPFKIVADGSLNTRTAWCVDPYPDACGHDAHGLCLVSPERLVSLMERAWAAGLEPAVHAIGDRANAVALDAFEAVGCPGRIEHAQLVRPTDVGRFARAGLVASVQPQHAVADRDVAERHWPGRTGQAFAYRALYEAGARLELGSDAPVSPADPWLAVADAVARTDDDRAAWHPEQALPLDVALTAACGGRPGIAVGDVADLTVVAGDVGASTPEELRHTEVLATLVGGEVTHLA